MSNAPYAPRSFSSTARHPGSSSISGSGSQSLSASFENPAFKSFPKQLDTDQLIQRGYMRLLSEVFELGEGGTRINTSDDMVHEALKHEVGSKLNFQFNPDSLNRSVTARTDTQLWINQSPTQLLQPGIGDMNFNWSMLFNREAEVTSNYIERRKSNARDLEGSADSGLDAWSHKGLTGTTAAAVQLGVLADIAILDRITGQSISKAQIDYAHARQQRLIDLQIIEDPKAGEGNTIMEIAEELDLLNPDNEDNILSANTHNAAFLIPNPVRAVFSKHFMVDGYVNSVTVSYQKFSPEMIPTIALVDISMHAIYQGFARRKTTFTTLMDLAERESLSESGTGEDIDRTERPDDGVIIELQRLGDVRPVLTGVDHTPAVDGLIGDHVPADPETHFTDHRSEFGSEGRATDAKNDEAKDSGTGADIAVHSVAVKVKGGFTLTPISYLDPYTGNNPLGTYLREAMQGNKAGFSRTSLTAEVHLGLSVRARLKGTKADIDWLTTEGGDSGFPDPNDRSAVFFGTWPTGQRKKLLGFGYDNLCGLTGAGSGASGSEEIAFRDGQYAAFTNQSTTQNGFTGVQTGQSGAGNGALTRSFPITSHHPESPHPDIKPGTYGDLLQMKKFVLQTHQIHIKDDDYIYLELANKQPLEWAEDETKYYLANGFWDKVNTTPSSSAANRDDDFVPFPYLGKEGTGEENYDLDDTSDAWRSKLVIGSRNFTVHYQMRLLIKNLLKYDGFTFSNTGWMAVSPRTINSELVSRGAGFEWTEIVNSADISGVPTGIPRLGIELGTDRSHRLQGELQGMGEGRGENPYGILDHNGYGADIVGVPWQTGGDDQFSHNGDLRGSQHFDGHMYDSGAGMVKWNPKHGTLIGASTEPSYWIGRTSESRTSANLLGGYKSMGSKFK